MIPSKAPVGTARCRIDGAVPSELADRQALPDPQFHHRVIAAVAVTLKLSMVPIT